MEDSLNNTIHNVDLYYNNKGINVQDGGYNYMKEIEIIGSN